MSDDGLRDAVDTAMHDVAQELGTYRTCPSCGEKAQGQPYDIGSGPELSCPNCEWCWGADGQDLNPTDAYQHILNDPELRKRMGWDDEKGNRNLMLGATTCRECGKTIYATWRPETGHTDPVLNCASHQ